MKIVSSFYRSVVDHFWFLEVVLYGSVLWIAEYCSGWAFPYTIWSPLDVPFPKVPKSNTVRCSSWLWFWTLNGVLNFIDFNRTIEFNLLSFWHYNWMVIRWREILLHSRKVSYNLGIVVELSSILSKKTYDNSFWCWYYIFASKFYIVLISTLCWIMKIFSLFCGFGIFSSRADEHCGYIDHYKIKHRSLHFPHFIDKRRFKIVSWSIIILFSRNYSRCSLLDLRYYLRHQIFNRAINSITWHDDINILVIISVDEFSDNILRSLIFTSILNTILWFDS